MCRTPGAARDPRDTERPVLAIAGSRWPVAAAHETSLAYLAPSGPRYVNIALGAWVFLSAFVWPHADASFTNSWLMGVLIVAFSIGALAAPALGQRRGRAVVDAEHHVCLASNTGNRLEQRHRRGVGGDVVRSHHPGLASGGRRR